MFNLLEIFEPYMLFITMFFTLLINIILIFKGLNWIALIVGNVIVIIVFELMGVGEYNFINVVMGYIMQIVGDLISSVIDGIGDFISGIIDSLKFWK